MVNNKIYREALIRALDYIALEDGRYLITGASGLIGSCLIDLLMIANDLGHQCEVFALGRSADKLKKRFSAFVDSEFFHVIEQDICNPIDDNLELDFIVHGASNADPRNYALYPAETMLINLQGAANVLNYCKNHLRCRMILLSTFEVYGNDGRDEYQETDYGRIDQNAIRSCYPESKRSAELLTRCYVQEYGINAAIARLCSIYGPTMAQNDSKAHAQFLRNALAGQDIVLKSKGEPRRTYMYVIDAVTALLAVLSRGEVCEVYNISNEKSIASIAEVAQTVASISDTSVVFDLPDEIEAQGFSKPQNCVLKNDKLRKLGWQGRYLLEDGMKETLMVLGYDKK